MLREDSSPRSLTMREFYPLLVRSFRMRWLAKCWLALFLAVGCLHTPIEETINKPVVLHLEYRTGGDGPLVVLVSWFQDGSVRFRADSGRVYWSKLTDPDLRSLETIVDSVGFLASLAKLRQKGVSCCDLEEVAIYRRTTSDGVHVVFEDSTKAPAPVASLIAFVNRLGTKYFGRHYARPIPMPGPSD